MSQLEVLLLKLLELLKRKSNELEIFNEHVKKFGNQIPHSFLNLKNHFVFKNHFC